MTLRVTITIAGNYKTSYTVNGVECVITGRGSDGPAWHTIHVDNPTTIVIQPDQYDDPAGSEPTLTAGSAQSPLAGGHQYEDPNDQSPVEGTVGTSKPDATDEPA